MTVTAQKQRLREEIVEVEKQMAVAAEMNCWLLFTKTQDTHRQKYAALKILSGERENN